MRARPRLHRPRYWLNSNLDLNGTIPITPERLGEAEGYPPEMFSYVFRFGEREPAVGELAAIESIEHEGDQNDGKEEQY